MAEIFVWKKDEWEEPLRRMGFYLGKFIYLSDAYEDLEKDRRTGNYNPFEKRSQQPDFEDSCYQILTMMMAECCKAFELLPILQDVTILRNILYSGVWTRYNMVHQRRHPDAEPTDKN